MARFISRSCQSIRDIDFVIINRIVCAETEAQNLKVIGECDRRRTNCCFFRCFVRREVPADSRMFDDTSSRAATFARNSLLFCTRGECAKE